jgi:ferredoxin
MEAVQPPFQPMPVIRFVREGLDVECWPGENLRVVALREGIELYGLKGKLGNCGGCGQCITCFVEVPEDTPASALSPRTPTEERKLRRRPQTWRLACQSLVQESLLVITRPQGGLVNREEALARSRSLPLPAGPTEWPTPPAPEDTAGEEVAAADGPGAPSSTTGDEEGTESTEPR